MRPAFSPSGRIIPPPPPSWQSWEELMARALTLADKAAEQGEIPVGALVVSPEGIIVGQGHNSSIAMHDSTAHAEIEAIRSACLTLGNYRLTNCVVIATLEPCLMCAGAMVHARIAGVVYGARDPKAGTIVSQIEALDFPFLNHSVWHLGGICEAESAARLHNFFSSK